MPMRGAAGFWHGVPMTREAGQQASSRIVDALIGDGLLDAARREQAERTVAAALTPAERPREEPHGGWPKLVEVVAYLGAALVVAAGFLLLMQQWDDLSETGRVLSLALVTVVLAIAGVIAMRAGEPGGAADDVRRRLTSTLLTAAAGGAGLTVGYWLDLRLDPDWQDLYWPAVAGAAILATGAALVYLVAPTALGQLAILGGVVTVATVLTDRIRDHEGVWVGTELLLIGLVWLAMAEARWFRELTVARVLGVAVALFGAQFPVIEGSVPWYGYLLTAGVVVLGVLLYLGRLAWPYLAAAVVGITLVVPEAVSDWTGGSLGMVGGVLLAGVTLLLASFAGYRLRASRE